VSQSLKHNLTEPERELLRSPPLTIVSSLNKDEFKRAWQSIGEVSRLYGAAGLSSISSSCLYLTHDDCYVIGIQTFTHMKHRIYKCQGPYVAQWQSGAASWHPSHRSHRLRASQMSYFWLLSLRDAIDELHLESHSRSVEDMLKETVRKLHSFYSHSWQHSKDVAKRHNMNQGDLGTLTGESQPLQVTGTAETTTAGLDAKSLANSILIERLVLPRHVYPRLVLDDVQCYTDYEPRSIREASLFNRVVGGLADSSNSSSIGWKAIIYENLVSEKLVQKSKARGYKDFKHLIYGNKDSGPLSFAIHAKRPGQVC
jgi:hypothetical protein